MGYRQSDFDPNAAWGQPGKPLRPYNWVQWTGVAFVVLGAIGYLAWAADRFGWIDLGLKELTPFVSLPLVGVALINSRREPGTPLDPEQRARHRRFVYAALALGIVFAILGAALAISLKSQGA